MLIRAVLINVHTKCIFYKNYDPDFDISVELLGGFLSAIDIFARGLGQDQIKEIVMDRRKFYYYVIDEAMNLVMVVIASQNAREHELKKYIGIIKDRFLDKFATNFIESHQCEPNFFDDFDLVIRDIIDQANEERLAKISDNYLAFPDFERPMISGRNLSVPFLVKFAGDSLDKLLFALFIGMRIVVAGEPSLVKIIVDTLQLFAPHRILKKQYWTEDVQEHGYDIVGVPPKLAPLYLDSTIMNLENRFVDGLMSNKYFESVAKKARKLKADKLVSYLDDKYEFLIAKAKSLATLVNQSEIVEDNINQFIRGLDKDTLKVLETYYYWNNPEYTEEVRDITERARTLLLAKGFLL